ncbi:hypothetical protein Tco_0482844, partial [Tanacetum coccineum]
AAAAVTTSDSDDDDDTAFMDSQPYEPRRSPRRSPRDSQPHVSFYYVLKSLTTEHVGL